MGNTHQSPTREHSILLFAITGALVTAFIVCLTQKPTENNLDARVQASLPDFTVEEMRLRPDPLTPHHTFSFLGNVRNLSTTTRAEDPSAAQLSIDEYNDGTIEAVSELRSVTSLVPSGHHLITWGSDQSIVWDPIPGTHRALFCAGLAQNGQGSLHDADESNNCVEFLFTVEGEEEQPRSAESSSAQTVSSENTADDSFTDELPEWAASAIHSQARLGIIRGYDDGRFGAADPVTRGQLATLMYRMLRHTGLITSEPTDCWQYFEDVPQGHFAYVPLCALVQTNRLDQELLFAQDIPPTRATTAVLIYRILGGELLSILGMTEDEVVTNMPSYPDIPAVDFAYEAAAVLRASEIISGYPDGNFGRDDTLNRAQAAMIMQRILDKIQHEYQGNSAQNQQSSSYRAAAPQQSSSRASSARSSTPASQTPQQPNAQAPQVPQGNAPAQAASADYAISATVVPPVIVEGGIISITATITNVGNAADSQSVASLYVDIGSDYNFDITADIDFTPALAPGQTDSHTWTNMPGQANMAWALTPGVHRVSFCANAPYGINVPFPEENRSNNCNELQITVLPAQDGNAQQEEEPETSLPDYEVTGVYTSPMMQEGGDYSFSASIGNIGGDATLPTSANIALDIGNDGIYDYWRTSENAYKNVPALEADSGTSVDWSNTDVPSSIDWIPSAGTHRVRICVNMNPDFAEDGNGQNNCDTTVFTVAETTQDQEEPVPDEPEPPAAEILPDFQIEWISASLQNNGKFNAGVSVRNAGEGASVTQTYVKLWLTFNGVLDSNSIQYKQLAPIAAGEEQIIATELGYLPNVSFIIHACVDNSYNGSVVIPETDETNNCDEKFVYNDI